MQQIERITIDLVNETLVENLKDYTGIGDVTGKIYLMSPDPLFVNERTEEIDNIDDTKYPCITIEPYETKMITTQNNPVKIIDNSSLNSTGTVKVWTSDLLLQQTTYFTLECTTKKEFRLYHELMIRFFQKYRNGMILKNDVLPNGMKENIGFMPYKPIKYDLTHSPYSAMWEIELFYRMYEETQKYLMLNYTISGTVSQSGKTVGYFQIDKPIVN